jgi:hypothetical protein
MTPDLTVPKPDETAPPKAPDHPVAAPVAQPSPPMDGKKPIPPGDQEIEKFLVSTDTGGGD